MYKLRKKPHYIGLFFMHFCFLFFFNYITETEHLCLPIYLSVCLRFEVAGCSWEQPSEQQSFAACSQWVWVDYDYCENSVSDGALGAHNSAEP